MSIEINWFSIHLNLLSTDFLFQPQRNVFIRTDINWNQITFNSLNLLSIDFPFKFQRNLLIRKDFIWNQLTFNSFESTFNWLFFKSTQKIPQKFLCTIRYHWNNYIIEDLGHSWGTPLRNCLGGAFKKGFNKASNYLGNLHFQGFNMDMVFESKWTSFTQRKVDNGFCVFSPHFFLCTIGYHRNNYIIEDLGHSWGTPMKNCLGSVFEIRV